ncbi:MAG: acetylglutamate kinase, partial [Bacteroidales bacterium]|nr:acetylglutamate kinase [Bacteroidales bacterium]
KVGGKVVEAEASLKKLVSDFTSIQGSKLLIHGGGNIATDIANRLNLQVEMVNGRRITNKDMLEVVTMVYGGIVNKNIVAGLQSHNCNALGLSGADLNVVAADKRPVKDIDYGFVGEVKRVNGEALKMLIDSEFVPVIAPLTHDNHGQMLNTNADDIANAIAVEMSKYYKVKLIFCFDKKGVLLDQNNEDSVITKLDFQSFKELAEKKIVNAGMIPKLENGFKSLQNGVSQVFITNVGSFAKTVPEGTELVA